MFEWLRPDVQLVEDLRPAEWFSSTLEPWPHGPIRLASFMPDGFPCYVRIFHPFELWDGYTLSIRRWSDVAAERGVPIDAETDAGQVAGEDWGAVGGNHPYEGEMPEAVCTTLTERLASRTQTPETCWFALWSGWGMLESTHMILSRPMSGRNAQRKHQRHQRREAQRHQREERSALRSIPQITDVHGRTGRDYLLFRGPIDAACSFEPNPGYRVLSPSFWWPDDRAWAVVTEIDGTSTYVGGTRAAIDELMAAEELETIEVDRNVRMG